MSEPQHRIHNPEDLLPGAMPSDPESVDYTAVDRMPSSAWQETPQQWQDVPSQDHSKQHDKPHESQYSQGKNAFTEPERPLNVQPAEGGGVSIGGGGDLPEGKAGLKDKIIGKTEKVLGKMTGKPEMHERGELRESGGKAAAKGEAKAPHD